MRRSAALSLLLLPLLPLPTFAAADPPAGEVFSETIDVDVVNVEVFVTDRSGRPVRGLGRDDFELRVDGKPVPITNFYAAESEPPAAGEAAAAPAAPAAAGTPSSPPPDPRLNLAVFVDNENLTPQARYKGLRALEGFFRSGLRAGDRVLLASYDGRALKLRRPPPGDVPAVLAALKDVGSVTAIGTHIQAEEDLALWSLLNGSSPAEKEDALLWLKTIDQQRQRTGRSVLTALADFMGSMAGLPGRRAVLYLTGELRVPTGDSMFRYLAERANAEQVTLYGLGSSAAGGRDLGPGGEGNRHLLEGLVADPDVLAVKLEAVAGPTGGLSGIDLDHPAALLDRIRDDLATYYSLGFAPAKRDGRPHALSVRVKARRGIEVRAPSSYTARTREERPAGHGD